MKSGPHPFFPARVFPALLSLALTPWQEGARAPAVASWLPDGTALEEAGSTHCALEAVVVVEAAPLAEATVKSVFWMDSAEVEAA